MGTYHGAQALGLRDYGLEPGCHADMVVLDAASPSAAIVGQVEKNHVFKAGRLMASSWVHSQLYNGSQLEEIQKS
jgi:cytosine deaminase